MPLEMTTSGRSQKESAVLGYCQVSHPLACCRLEGERERLLKQNHGARVPELEGEIERAKEEVKSAQMRATKCTAAERTAREGDYHTLC